MLIAQTFQPDIFMAILLCTTALVGWGVSAFMVALLERAVSDVAEKPTDGRLWATAVSATVLQLTVGAGLLYVIGGMAWPVAFGQWAVGMALVAPACVAGAAVVYCRGLGVNIVAGVVVGFAGFLALMVSMPTAVIAGAFAAVMIQAT